MQGLVHHQHGLRAPCCPSTSYSSTPLLSTAACHRSRRRAGPDQQSHCGLAPCLAPGQGLGLSLSNQGPLSSSLVAHSFRGSHPASSNQQWPAPTKGVWNAQERDELAPSDGGASGAGSTSSADNGANADLLLDKQATVQFHLKYKTNYGQAVKLLGSHARLGSWNLKNSLEMRWTPGDMWVATVQLPAGGVYEYKYVLIDYETKQALEWQMGSNAVLAVVVNETEVNVFDNWGNAPGAMVKVDEDSMTRETKLQKWATEMMGYWKEARKLQIELVHKSAESAGLRNELAQLRMELSLERQQRMGAETQVTELQVENAHLKSQLVAKTVELNNTLAEVLQLLDKELEEDEAEDGTVMSDRNGYDHNDESDDEGGYGSSNGNGRHHNGNGRSSSSDGESRASPPLMARTAAAVRGAMGMVGRGGGNNS